MKCSALYPVKQDMFETCFKECPMGRERNKTNKDQNGVGGEGKQKLIVLGGLWGAGFEPGTF